MVSLKRPLRFSVSSFNAFLQCLHRTLISSPHSLPTRCSLPFALIKVKNGSTSVLMLPGLLAAEDPLLVQGHPVSWLVSFMSPALSVECLLASLLCLPQPRLCWPLSSLPGWLSHIPMGVTLSFMLRFPLSHSQASTQCYVEGI